MLLLLYKAMLTPPRPRLHDRAQILTIASGGIDSVDKAAELSDEGYDAIVMGRSLVAGGGGGGREGSGASGPELIRGIADRVGVPRSMLGWGLSAEDLDIDARR